MNEGCQAEAGTGGLASGRAGNQASKQAARQAGRRVVQEFTNVDTMI